MIQTASLRGIHESEDTLKPGTMSFSAFSEHLNSVNTSNKYRRQRGLLILTGVSYTNFKLPIDAEVLPLRASTNKEPLGVPKLLHRAGSYFHRVDSKILVLCGLWYALSVISLNLTKSILRSFPFPVTLTEIQFLLTLLFCLAAFSVAYSYPHLTEGFPPGTFPIKKDCFLSLVSPSRRVLTQTVPMGMFQFVGHITSHNATSLVSVSTVHTIKALSPLVTVLGYRTVFGVRYPTATYLTLCPLVLGIMLTCLFRSSGKVGGETHYFRGLFYAFILMLIFVSQNMFAKRIVTYQANLLGDKYSNILPVDKAEEQAKKRLVEKKLDKLTILFFCLIIGFCFTFPLYLSSEFFSNTVYSLSKIDVRVMILMVGHGLVHFVQALLAFHILGLISPVSYSIANIFKRIVVIVAALFWEGQTLNLVQGIGLVLTITGLYCYDRWGAKK